VPVKVYSLTKSWEHEEVAALIDIGILNQADFGVDGTPSFNNIHVNMGWGGAWNDYY
jgi:hypothetical protein